MEPITNKPASPDLDLLRRYRIYNPSLFIAPLEPGAATLYPGTTTSTFRRARDWSAADWPKNANVAIATGASNHLLVVSARSNADWSSFIARMVDEEGAMTPYVVKNRLGIHTYLRAPLDRALGSARSLDLKKLGLSVYGDHYYVPGAGSVISGVECKTMLDATLDVSKLPEPSQKLADFLGLPEISLHPSFTPRLRLI